MPPKIPAGLPEPASVIDALRSPYQCHHGCYQYLSVEEKVQGIEALYRFDDAMRGWGFTVVWDLGASVLWQVSQVMDHDDNRFVVVRDSPCVYSRLVGFCTHELIHALTGDPDKANFGIPFGLPYRVPEDLSPADEADYLHSFNLQEARAWAGMPIVAERFFGIEWTVEPARDVGTYGFIGGNAMVDPLPGYRCVPHYDSTHHQRRYYARARRLEAEAREWFTDERLDQLEARFRDAEALGRERRPFELPPARELARLKPLVPGRNDLCPCGSTRKYKKCCGANR
jgi:hypothetical protein